MADFPILLTLFSSLVTGKGLTNTKTRFRLRKETLVTVAWIAERLQMGSVANVNTLLYQWRQTQK